MPRKANAQRDARIATLRREHKTEAEIAAVLTREGEKITVSGVHRALGRLGLAAPRDGAVGASGKAPGHVTPSAPPSRPESTSEDVPDIEETLRQSLVSLQKAVESAEIDKDVARIIAAQRAITQLAGLLVKLTPAPPPDIDAAPDMVAAAKRGREKAHALFAALLKAAA